MPGLIAVPPEPIDSGWSSGKALFAYVTWSRPGRVEQLSELHEYIGRAGPRARRDPPLIRRPLGVEQQA